MHSLNCSSIDKGERQLDIFATFSRLIFFDTLLHVHSRTYYSTSIDASQSHMLSEEPQKILHNPRRNPIETDGISSLPMAKGASMLYSVRERGKRAGNGATTKPRCIYMPGVSLRRVGLCCRRAAFLDFSRSFASRHACYSERACVVRITGGACKIADGLIAV